MPRNRIAPWSSMWSSVLPSVGALALCACAAQANYLDPKMELDESTSAPPAIKSASYTTTGEGGLVRPEQKSERPARGSDEDVSQVVPLPGPPVITLPGFRMLDAGRSRVFVEVSDKVEFNEIASDSVLRYHLSGVTVPEKVNRMMLPTGNFWWSPTQRVHVEQAGDGADLVIELRAKTEHSVKVSKSPFGMRLTIEFPPVKWEQRATAEVIPIHPDRPDHALRRHVKDSEQDDRFEHDTNSQ